MGGIVSVPFAMSVATRNDGIERQLREIKTSLRNLEDRLPSLRKALANRKGNNIETPTVSFAPFSVPPTADQSEDRQRAVKLEPEDEPEAQTSGEQSEEKPQIGQVHGRKRRNLGIEGAPSSKLARITEEPKNMFTIFNYKGPLKRVTPEHVARTLPLLGAKGLFLPSDIQLLEPRFLYAYVLGVACLRFEVRGPMAEHLQNWVNGQSYVEDSHLENKKHCSHFSQHSYLLVDTHVESISLFALLISSAPEIETFVKTTVKLAPNHLEFFIPGGKRTVLTIKELMTDEWLPIAKKAYKKITRHGKKSLNLRVQKIGYPMTIWK